MSAPVTTKNWLPEVPGRLGAALRHRHHALRVGGVRGRRIDRLVPGAAAPGLGRVAALDHEAGDDPVEDHVVVEARLRERDERGGRCRCLLEVERDRERAAVRLEHEVVGLLGIEALGRRRLRHRPHAQAGTSTSVQPSAPVVVSLAAVVASVAASVLVASSSLDEPPQPATRRPSASRTMSSVRRTGGFYPA